MTAPRLLWIGYRGNKESSHFEVVEKLKNEKLIDFFVATGASVDSGEWKLVDEPVIPHFDAQFAKYKIFLPNSKFLIDQEIYSLCSSFEGETLRMMDRLHKYRLDKFSSKFDVDDSFELRRRMFLLHCSFWYQYLADKKITHVAFLGVPHEVYSFVIYKLASLLNVKTIIFASEKSGQFKSSRSLVTKKKKMVYLMEATFFISENIEDIGVWRLSTSVCQSASRLGINFYPNEELFAENKTQDQKLLFNDIEPVPKKFVGLLLKRVVRVIRNFGSSIKTLKLLFQTKLRYVEHSKLVSTDAEMCKSVLFCLAYQPEESTSPRGGVFVEQYFAINLLAACLPEGWGVRVREHPDQYRRLRPRQVNFLREISQIPNVKIVSPGETPIESFERATAVAATSGSMGVDAWFAGLPTIVFGETWLKNAPGVFYVRSISDAKDALSQINQGFQQDKIAVKEFMNWTISNSYKGNLWSKNIQEKELRDSTVANLYGILKVWIAS